MPLADELDEKAPALLPREVFVRCLGEGEELVQEVVERGIVEGAGGALLGDVGGDHTVVTTPASSDIQAFSCGFTEVFRHL